MKLTTALIATVLSCAVSAQANTTANTEQFNDIMKDMRIMKRIIETSISEGSRSGKRVEAIYLAHQGMVFRIYSGGILPIPEFDGDWDAWGEALGASALSYVQDVIPAVAPVLPPDAVAEMEAEIEEGLAELNRDESTDLTAIREELAKMREQVRKSKEAYRDSLRQLREIEQERYQAEGEQRKLLDNKRAEIEQRLKQSQQIMEAYQQKMTEYRKQKVEQQQQKKSQLIKETLIALCDYKASLRALDSDQYVTLIFADFGAPKGKDKILVLKKSDTVNCDSSPKGIERLMAKATVYTQ
jgi:hypothetical protein